MTVPQGPLIPAHVQELRRFLDRSRVAGLNETVEWAALGGGVSSDIWRLDVRGSSYCVKRALAKLKVSSDWFAPLSRSAYEWEWLRFAYGHLPKNVPEPIAFDEHSGVLVMRYLDGKHHALWKRQLLDGDVSASFASLVGNALSDLHAASAGDPLVPSRFASDDNFMALRLAPYFLHAAVKNPDLLEQLDALVHRTAATKIALVHGDVSPKNILAGPCGPVLLDAECAWFGDPAFDIAFCMSHLLLKSLRRPFQIDCYLSALDGLWKAYRSGISWEDPKVLETRVTELLPALLLARVDGKSPVEYLVDAPSLSHLVRTTSKRMILSPPATVSDLTCTWRQATDNMVSGFA